MKTKIISAILALVLLLSVSIVFSNAEEVKDKDFGTNGGIEERINKIKEVYDSDSFFTVSGGPSYSNQCSDCELMNIPARGNLPSGEEAAKECYNSWSCCSFARYVFYNVFKCNPERQISVSADELSYGDYIYLSGRHYAIYLGQDDENWYVYHGNGDGQCGVEFMDALDKGSWSFTFGYHAKNYDDINGLISKADEPELPELTNTKNGVKLSMKPMDNVSKYKIYRKDTSNIFNKFTEIGISDGNTYIDETTENGKTYFYTVQALNTNKEEISTYNNTGTYIFFLESPVINDVKLDNLGNLNINWQNVEDAKTYQVYVKVNGKYEKISDETNMLYILNNDFEYEKTYDFKVQAISKEGTKSGLSDAFSFTPKK